MNSDLHSESVQTCHGNWMPDNNPQTRLIMMGSAALTAGFSLIGFETWPDATDEQLEQLLIELQQRGDTALIFLEPELANCDCNILQDIQKQGGHIVVTEIPPLDAPGDYRPQVEDLVISVLGKSALETKQESS